MKRWFVLLLAVAICCAPLSAALAEAGVQADGALVESPDGAALPVPEEIEVPLEGDGEGNDPPAAIDVAESPVDEVYASGYGRVIAESAAVYDAPGAAEPFVALSMDDIVLATELDEAAQRLQIAFNSARGIIVGWIDAAALQKLTDDEVDAFMVAIAANVEALYLDDINCPLATLDCRFADEADEETDPAVKPTSVESDAENVAEEPTVVASSDEADSEVQTEVGNEMTVTDAPAAAQAADPAPADAPAPTTAPTPTPTAAPVVTVAPTPAPTAVPTPEATPNDGGERAVAAAVPAGPPTDFTLPTALTLGLKEAYSLLTPALVPANSVTTFTWRSSKPKVVEVDPNTGELIAKKKGKAVIYAKSANGIERSCTVTVMKTPKAVELNEKSVVLVGGGKTFQLKATLTKKTASTIYYTSSNPGVATVSASGLITTVAPGTTTITARTFNSKTATCTVKVLDPSLPQPVKIQLASTDITIGVKQTYKLNPTMLSNSGAVLSGAEYTVTSSLPKKLKVAADGTITGLKKGNYTVKVTAYNGVSTTATVHVVKAPGKVALSPKDPVLGVGQTRKLTASFPKGGVGTVSFSSSNTSVLTVDGSGNVTGRAVGSAVVTARTHNGKTAKVTVKVTRSPEYVALNADYHLDFNPLTGAYSTVYTKTLSPGQTFQLKCEVEYGTYGDITGYESKNPAVATVSSSGLITAKAAGTAIIVARATGGAETCCKVTVSGSLPAQIAFTASDASVRAGQTVAAPSLKGTNIDAAGLAKATYASSNTGIFTVAWSDADAEWKITGVKAGSATLTATAGGGVAQLPVTVAPAAAASTQIHFTDSVAYLAVAGTWKPTVYDEYDIPVAATYASSAPEIVSVDASGTLTGVAEGEARITATAGSMTAATTVRVRSGLATVALSPASLTLATGQKSALAAKVNGDSSANVTWASSDASVASVSASGVVVARKAGAATITATAYGGGKATCAVTVKSAPTTVSIQPASITARLDEGGAQLSWAFGNSSELGTVAFTSGNTGVATVNDKGYVTFKGVGATTITLTTGNGLMTSIDVTVTASKPVSTTPTYRLFAAYEYFNPDVKGYLPFPENNAKSVASVFSQSSISGLGYSTKVMGNPTKTALFSGMSSFFSGTTDVDVSIVYLCSHGHMTSGYGGYRMSLPGYDDNPSNANYYMSSQEIFNCVSRIRGNVVLILDSCYSGAFLQDMSGQLAAQGGRIAVLTAASDTRATYYNVKKTEKTVDFFTFFLLKGLGYNHRDKWWNSNAAGKKGAYPGYLAADASGNGDGIVTLGEFYEYASKSIAANIPSYMKKSWYWGDKSRVQVPRYYAGKLNDLVIYKAK